ncbi:Fe-S cluster domain protein [Spirochaeta thermophila DSM 6578]|uniref:Fe-S cluster domain protein n=1 Tax=Winmispira thermophila (strain ATCC 700085 / DSM 6578 / Z-1203) TaxID=869211 RepID=G0GFC5_WINT7|nr:[Fe-Fe] hydrogenase large subunit C-terminal domain-containing protein [Spirochaeta thermophila]AEJ61539.1 Fe-S cluster domain protein [Spirochaeta thermophila DSM 6578]
MTFQRLIYTVTSDCFDCYKCIRECPVKAIRISSGRAEVVEELCLYCGHCVEVCPSGAKRVRSDVDRAKTILSLRSKVVLSLAPSFPAFFRDTSPQELIAACRKLGFHAVSETAVGADIVSEKIREMLSGHEGQGEGRLLISSACPVIVEYISRYRPDLLPCVIPVGSPMRAHAEYLKSVFGHETAVVFAGPCIAKKREAEQSGGVVDLALTFSELAAWMEEAGVYPSDLRTDGGDFYPSRSSYGALYPVQGGAIRTLERMGTPGSWIFESFSGITQIARALDGLDIDSLDVPLFLELLACEGGCINGPAFGSRRGSLDRHLKVLSYAEGASREWVRCALPLEVEVHGDPYRETPISDEEIREALRSVGKYSPEDELNCSGCGYDTCRAFAEAMVRGRAERTMCVSYMRKLAQKKANALLKTMPSAAVVVDQDLKVVECNSNFAHLWGAEIEGMYGVRPGLEGADLRKIVPFWKVFQLVLDDQGPELVEEDFRVGKRIIHGSIFVIERGAVAGGLFQDITVPWIQRDRIVQQARKVMKDHLRTVQKVAYLLGENAAEMEATLSSIVESFEGEHHG